MVLRMVSHTSAKNKVSSDDVTSSSSSQDSCLTNSDDTILGDDPFEMRSNTSDCDAAKDMILHASAPRIKVPEGEKPSRRRPWVLVRAEYSSDHGAAEAMQRLLPEEAHARIAHDVDGLDNVSQSNRECQSRELVRRQSVSAPMSPTILELSQKVTVTEIRSTLPSLRSATSKPNNACPDSENSHSRSDSVGFLREAKSRQYSMLRFNATPTLSTACDPVKTKRPCSARERVTRSGETRRALNSRSLTEPEETPPDTKDSFGPEGLMESVKACRPALSSRSLTEPEAAPQDTMDFVGQEASLAACKRVAKFGKARRPALNSLSLTEPEATSSDFKEKNAEALNSFRKLPSSEARVVLNTYMRDLFSTRAPPINYRHRRRSS
eukprot:TRINITY_DN7034_c0_g4_i1.p1 TRINITY_DN7034_c0_g4~~TRINITY_DN7034_c0_g4_i1.p1  ORF type:complete len:381 (-),score=23.57 TRINITY_DN7034_c0_g4_i1:369-1511(-)